MANIAPTSGNPKRSNSHRKRTSIGLYSRPKNKNGKRLKGKTIYRGQGR